MATKTVVTLVDDLTGEGGEDVANVSFGLDGATYEIDLDENNATALREAFAAYIAVARRTGGRTTRRMGQRTAAGGTRPAAKASGGSVTTLPAQKRPRSREENQRIREWANRNGLPVAERGRIPEEVATRYETEQKRKQAG